MWFLLFAYFIALSSANLANEHLCGQGSFEICAKPDTFPVSLPENEDDLDKICPVILEFTQCTWDYEENCSPEIEMAENRRHFKGLLGVLEDTCREDSFLHKAVSENAKCLKIIIQEQNSTCYEATERALELYSEMTKKTTEEADSVTVTEESDENWNSYVCFFHVYDISCLVADADKRCGSAAKHVVLEMVRRIAYFEWICPPNILKELPSIVELLELEEEEKILLRDILPKE
ncbi:uncharacterized protein LOC118187607 isoform X3 [Stegodyphus dumicola]|uniref:uncharacterized protein LOC118187607 isoform X3 n=1 Tax=Stegodyphus dumicola TaxID=202533 RepID=UPI0015AB1FED|nr:uncharacterized protein LOC118187607 isoform X3 [Stegodyphus dumicola]